MKSLAFGQRSWADVMRIAKSRDRRSLPCNQTVGSACYEKLQSQGGWKKRERVAHYWDTAELLPRALLLQ